MMVKFLTYHSFQAVLHAKNVQCNKLEHSKASRTVPADGLDFATNALLYRLEQATHPLTVPHCVHTSNQVLP